MANQLRQQIEQISREKNINPDVIIAAIEDAILTASKKYYKGAEDLRSRFNEDTGQIEVFAVKQIVETVEIAETQLGLEEARECLQDERLRVGEQDRGPQEATISMRSRYASRRRGTNRLLQADSSVRSYGLSTPVRRASLRARVLPFRN